MKQIGQLTFGWMAAAAIAAVMLAIPTEVVLSATGPGATAGTGLDPTRESSLSTYWFLYYMIISLWAVFQ